MSILVDPVNLTIVAGRDVEAAISVKGHVPDVLRLGIEEYRGRELGRARIVGLCRTRDLVDLAVGRGRGKDCAISGQSDGLDLQLFRLEDGRGFPVGRDPVDTRRRGSSGVYDAIFVRGNGPDVTRWTGVNDFEGGRKFQSSSAADRHTAGGAASKIVVAGFGPKAGALRSGQAYGHQGQNKGRFFHHCIYISSSF